MKEGKQRQPLRTNLRCSQMVCGQEQSALQPLVLTSSQLHRYEKGWIGKRG